MTIRIASYNIRKAVGLDWRRDAFRVMQVLAEIDADIVLLQEADKRLAPRDGVLCDTHLGRELGYQRVDYGGAEASHGWHGNAVLYRAGRLDLSEAARIPLPSLEPRGAVRATFGPPRLRVIGVHLGLTPGMRKRQLRTLSDHMSPSDGPVLLAGDFNTHATDSRIGALLGGNMQVISPGHSFHSALPFAPFDRFVLNDPDLALDCHVHRSDLARRASDHLPIVADLDLAPPD